MIEDKKDLTSRGYSLYGLWTEQKILACVAGVIIQPHVERGNEFWIHDLVTMPQHRSKGYGTEMMSYLENVAKSLGCDRVVLHTRSERQSARDFYNNKANFQEYAVVFQKTF